VMDVTVHCLDQNVVKNRGLQEAFPPICRSVSFVCPLLLSTDAALATAYVT